MIYGRIPALSNTNRGTLNPDIYSSATGTSGIPVNNPDFLRLFIAQMSSPNLDSLFGNEENDTSIFGGFGIPSSTSDLFGGFSTGIPSTSFFGQNSLYSGFSPQLELAIWSNLVGKTVEVINPQTQEMTSGKVQSIVLQNGQVMLDVDGLLVPTNNLLKAK